MPLHSSPRRSHSPTWIPARMEMPWDANAGASSSPQRTALVGPSNKRENAVPRVLGTTAAVLRQHAVDQLVVGVQLMSPPRVATGTEQFRRADDVGEQHRLQHSFVDGGTGPAGHEIAYRRGQRVVEQPMRSRRQGLDLGSGNGGGQRGNTVERCHSIALTPKEQGRRTDGTENAADVDLQQRLPQPRRHRRTGTRPLVSAVELAESWHVGNLVEEYLGQCAFTPVTFDVFEMPCLLLDGEPPRMIG